MVDSAAETKITTLLHTEASNSHGGDPRKLILGLHALNETVPTGRTAMNPGFSFSFDFVKSSMCAAWSGKTAAAGPDLSEQCSDSTASKTKLAARE